MINPITTNFFFIYTNPNYTIFCCDKTLIKIKKKNKQKNKYIDKNKNKKAEKNPGQPISKRQ